MACPSENELLDAMEGRLPEAERAAFELHVKGCSACRELLATSLHATTTLIDSAGEPSVGPGGFAPESLVGATVGEYVVEQMIGRGGMGIVYRGAHPVLGKAVAIKILRPELAADADHMRRMLSEARAMSAIAHRSIVDVFAFGELDDGRQYMVMELLQGEPLNRLIRAQAPMPPLQLLALLEGIVDAIAATHAAGVIHRDLKPSNLFLVREAEGTTAIKLLDFGLAKRERDDQGHTRAGRLVLGTPGYMAPEQIRAHAVTPATDLYALGVIAYELATGKRPFRGRDAFEVMRAQVGAAPASPSQHVKNLPPGLERLILHLMEKKPADRPASAEAVRTALKQLRAGLAPKRRHVWLPVTVGVAAGLFAAAWWFGWTPARPPVAVPQREAPPVAAAPAPVVPVPEPAVAPAVEPVVEPDDVAPVVRGQRPNPKAALLERAGRLRKRLAKATPRGEEADPTTTMLIANAERDARAARGDAELKKVEQTLADIERKYFKR